MRAHMTLRVRGYKMPEFEFTFKRLLLKQFVKEYSSASNALGNTDLFESYGEVIVFRNGHPYLPQPCVIVDNKPTKCFDDDEGWGKAPKVNWIDLTQRSQSQ